MVLFKSCIDPFFYFKLKRAAFFQYEIVCNVLLFSPLTYEVNEKRIFYPNEKLVDSTCI